MSETDIRSRSVAYSDVRPHSSPIDNGRSRLVGIRHLAPTSNCAYARRVCVVQDSSRRGGTESNVEQSSMVLDAIHAAPFRLISDGADRFVPNPWNPTAMLNHRCPIACRARSAENARTRTSLGGTSDKTRSAAWPPSVARGGEGLDRTSFGTWRLSSR
jgi:hypothetical protein